MDRLEVVREVLEESKSKIVEALKNPEVFKPVSGRTLLIDKLAEKIVVDLLSKKIGGFILMSEEAGVVKVHGGGSLIAILDPIDGSTNASRGFPLYSTSLALAEDYSLNDVVAGGVIDFSREAIYYAAKGVGAFLDGKRVTVSKVKSLRESVIALDVSAKGRVFKYLPLLSPIVERAYSIRSLGSNALHLCMVASGIFDAFIDLRGVLRAIDASAGVLVVREAGGVVTDGFGVELNFKLTVDARVSLVATSTVELASEIVKVLGFKPKS
ncbi:inositol monophosphatase [Candidatus Bathyarchaeota archaeon]|nr:inositol monophosphatase [Candidatus Bathyarchaeota archaeon]